MYKLVVMDMDGTLLTSDKKIGEYTKNIIQNYSNKVKIVLASARGFCTIKNYLLELNLVDNNNYTIAYNGGLISKNSGEIIVKKSIATNKLELLEEYIKKWNDSEWFYYFYEDRISRNKILNINEFIHSREIYKVVCISNEKEIVKMRDEMPKELEDEFQITSSETTRIEFVPKGITKVEALKFLINLLNIKQEEIISIGDGENDIDMIKFSGCGVAMGNASENVKKISDKVTLSNDEDVVGKILNELLSNY